jgi:hypothetical protein
VSYLRKNPPAETVLSLDSVPLTAYTRKLRSNVSREALQDIKSHLTDAEKEIEALMVNEIADSIDQDIIGYMISIARKADDDVFLSLGSELF